MPALATAAIVGAATLFVWALCRAAADGDRHAQQVIAAHVDRHPARAGLRLVPCEPRPYDWQLDVPDLSA